MAAKILIVEDDPVARHVVFSALKSAKYETVVAADALSALSMTQKEKPDLIILDLGLPAGGGFTFLQRLKAFPALTVIPILVVSGADSTVNGPKALQAGAVAFLAKPVNADVLLPIVRRLLHEE